MTRALFYAAAMTSSMVSVNMPGPTDVEVIRRDIPNLPGVSAHAIRVRYGPLASSPPHNHKAFLIAYVLSGSIESQVGDGPVRIYKAGDSWSEDPGERHVVCRNPSSSNPAELLVTFVGPRDGAV